MPRRAKTQTGAPAQPIAPVPGQTYGLGQAEMEMQRNMPAPQVVGASGGTPAPAPDPVVPATGATGAPAPPAAPPDLMQLAAATPGGPGLFNEPGEGPLTAGLSTGPGAGPGALQMPARTPIGDTFRMLSDATGDPYFRQLAEKNGQ